MDTVSFTDWMKVQMKVGKIVSVEKVPDSSKLYRLQIDLGGAEPVQVVSGLQRYYTEDELQGKLVIVVANLEPKKLAGLESNGMVLCASDHDSTEDTCVLLTTMTEVKPGMKVT